MAKSLLRNLRSSFSPGLVLSPWWAIGRQRTDSAEPETVHGGLRFSPPLCFLCDHFHIWGFYAIETNLYPTKTFYLENDHHHHCVQWHDTLGMSPLHLQVNRRNTMCIYAPCETRLVHGTCIRQDLRIRQQPIKALYRFNMKVPSGGFLFLTKRHSL